MKYLMQRINNHNRAVYSYEARVRRIRKSIVLLSSDAVLCPKPRYRKRSTMITVVSPRCVDYRFAKLLNKELCQEFGGTYGIRSPNGLAYALDIPCLSIFGAPAYAELALNTAKMIESIVVGHVFTDGNKRTAWSIALFFCTSNGYLLDPSYPEAGRDAIVSLINHEISVEELADFINANLLER